MTAYHQFLDHIVFVALEPRARRRRHDNAILVDDQTLRTLAPALSLAPPSPRRRARSFHPARLDRRAPLQTLEARNLIARRGDRLLQRRDFLKQLQHQSLEIIRCQTLNIW